MLPFAIAVLSIVVIFIYKKRRAPLVENWVHEQLEVASFRYAGEIGPEDRLRLRALENRRLKAAFGIENSLTTTSHSTHKVFFNKASSLLKRKDRSWLALYSAAEAFIATELATAVKNGETDLRLAESVRCMVLAIVLLDSFGVNPDRVARDQLVIITDEINNQWLESKCHPDDVVPSPLLNSTISSLLILSPFRAPDNQFTGYDSGRSMSPAEVLALLMPQYETLWRVVLLTFVTAYHGGPATYHDAVQRTADVPACLGNPAGEGEALKLAKVSLLHSCLVPILSAS